MDKSELNNYIKDGRLKLHIVANAHKNIISYDSVMERLIVRVKSPARDNLANKELLYFLKKKYGLKATIVKGKSAKDKYLSILS